MPKRFDLEICCLVLGELIMTEEIEEKISEEIDVANYKLQRSMEKVAENYNKAVDEADTPLKQIECLKSYVFYQRKCLDNFLIEIKAIQEKYQKELSEN